MKKISIIIPVYGVEDCLEKCLDSVINQTYKNLEIILIDDGSKDNCPKICDEYAKKDNRIKVIHKENGGISDTRNVGLDAATGDYIGFVDSDDYIKEDMFEVMCDLIETYNADMSIVSFFEIRKGKIIDARDSGDLFVMTKEEAIKEILKDTKIQSYPWNKLYKKELFDGVRYPVGKNFEDIATTLLLFEKSNRVVLKEQPEYYYVRRNESITENRSYKSYKDYIEVALNKYLYLFNKYPYDVEIEEYNAYNFIINMIWFYCVINAYNLEELKPDFDKIYPLFVSLVNKHKDTIEKEMNIFNKTVLNMMLIDKDSTRVAIKEFYLSQRIKRENGNLDIQI